jgi:hypothetical protein
VKRLLFATFSFTVFGAVAAAAPACSSSSSDGGASSDGGVDRARLKEPYRPDASCPVVIESPDLLPSPHVPEDQDPQYNSNPPSSGPHYPIWANYQEFSSPVKPGYLVHCEEHGGVLLLYKCDGAACAPIQEGLRKIRDAIPADPACDPKIRARIVIAPDPKLDVPVAAAAWGWTYKAQCVDAPTLEEFVKTHYNQGTEDTCAAGKTTF